MSRPIANVGVPEVPLTSNLRLYELLQWLRNTVLGLQAALIPPGTPGNFRVTALGGAIQVDFTRSDGDRYILYWNSAPSVNGAVLIDLGNANKYVDDIGAGSVKRWYAIEARKGNVIGQLSPWLSTTTLALGTAITPPTPPPGTETPFTDDETDAVALRVPNKGTFDPL